jgi:hypothetical protein
MSFGEKHLEELGTSLDIGANASQSIEVVYG